MIDEFTGEHATIQFDLSCDVYVWKRQAVAEEGGGEHGHLHYNAAISMGYEYGVFTWEEHGPWHGKNVPWSRNEYVPWNEGEGPWETGCVSGACTTELGDIIEPGKGQRKAVTHGHGEDQGNDVGYLLDHSGMFLKIIDIEYE
ncbi:hypothetical protein SAMN02745866_02520 [Alteromonadaceae bacterium Bs31]|nr:hypothetical protein SAMN02745866_02520 [Alteromonadaceae bacterium Bs31]